MNSLDPGQQLIFLGTAVCCAENEDPEQPVHYDQILCV